MSEAKTKQKLLEQASMLAKTNDPTAMLAACAGLLDALGSLMSEWTGEVVRVRMTAEGQTDVLDMVKRPSAAGAPAAAPTVTDVLAAEREACAKLCDSYAKHLRAFAYDSMATAAESCAESIRARTEGGAA